MHILYTILEDSPTLGLKFYSAAVLINQLEEIVAAVDIVTVKS